MMEERESGGREGEGGREGGSGREREMQASISPSDSPGCTCMHIARCMCVMRVHAYTDMYVHEHLHSCVCIVSRKCMDACTAANLWVQISLFLTFLLLLPFVLRWSRRLLLLPIFTHAQMVGYPFSRYRFERIDNKAVPFVQRQRAQARCFKRQYARTFRKSHMFVLSDQSPVPSLFTASSG